MTVDHLKMLHTAGGKGKVSCLIVGQQFCGEAAVRGVRAQAFGGQCAAGVLGESEWKLMFRQEFGTFFYLTRFAASLAVKHFTVLAPGCSRGEWF